MGAEKSVIVAVQIAIIALIGILLIANIPSPGPDEPFHQLSNNLKVEFAQALVLAVALLGGFGFTILALFSRGR